MSSAVKRFRVVDGEVREVTGPSPVQPTPHMGQAYNTANPLVSLSLSCHPESAGEYNSAAKELGLTGIEWDRQGRCLITSRKSRREWLRANHQHDGDGGYGD